ncbi:hypothetical protein ABEB36_001237 [Hypothenemus hampei]|uniref:N-acetylmuramoyl-L-alanine amidase domain-containing protein n=1 Tax=Hypothenemus hampei TaxID=57062 RepID=A0ABD1FDW4_HYPHA
MHVGVNSLSDIAYNFLIGGDGNIYIGRGGTVANEDMPDAIDVAYIGNYFAPFDQVSEKMNEAGIRLCAWLQKIKWIQQDFIVVAHNQTQANIDSPGENVYKKIIIWPNYDPGLYIH